MGSRIVHGLATGVHATSSRRRPTPRHHAVWLLACAGMLMGAATDARSRPCGSSAPPLPKKSIAALGALIKAAVDIPGMSDDDETEIIQSAVEKIVADVESFMPRAYWERIVTSKAVPNAQRELLQSRLLVYYGDKLPYLPYLSEDDERLILHATIAILTDAMGNTKLDDILSQETTSLSLIAIYIREAMGIDDVEILRRKVADMINLPIPMPQPVVNWLIEKGVAALLSVLSRAVDVSLLECFGKDATHHVKTIGEFQAVLRGNVTRLLHNKMSVVLLPAFVERFVISSVIDTYFELYVTNERINTAVSSVIRRGN